VGQITPLDEERWTRAAQRGDVEAFDWLVEAHESMAYHVAYRILEDPHDAADATQEAFLSAYRAIGHLRGAFKPWLARIVVNASYDLLRRGRSARTTSLELVMEEMGEPQFMNDRTGDPEGAALSQELRATIEDALAQLPEDQRLAITLVDVHGLAYDEAAHAMACPVGTVRSRLARGRDRIRQLLVTAGSLS
jgi:RNA polymerase sigma-70 factor (ECF subfamily)